jgi:hypothetical protein
MEQSSGAVSLPIAVAADGSTVAGPGGDGSAEWRAGFSVLATAAEAAPETDGRAPWTLVTNHGLALLVIAAQPSCRISEIARVLGITERATIRMVNDLVRAGYLARTRIGRRNAYAVNRDARLRHPAFRWQSVTALLRLLDQEEPGGGGTETVIPLRTALPRQEVVAGAR